MLPDKENPPDDVLMKPGAQPTHPPAAPPFSLSLSFASSTDMEDCMATSRTLQSGKPRRRLGRPPSKIKKVTVSVRIPTDLDAFLDDYSDEHRMLKGDVIAEAVMLFRLRKTVPRARAASGD